MVVAWEAVEELLAVVPEGPTKEVLRMLAAGFSAAEIGDRLQLCEDDVHALAAQAALAPDRVLRALARLGAAGRVGFDTREGAYFHRELPYDATLLEAMHPRLRDARDLALAGAVRWAGDVGHVRSGDVEYTVRPLADGYRCSCPWYGKHQDNRGPCKHVLAVEMVRRG